ncbi:MAG: ABC transporter ATP-binding protein [Bifidobacteriaceae bacterium]|jgi:ABC-2 type transport system ATP-binding protein|nr:ABC transporter ATP-binding protein [Bifidobacteriaceae bacterium]
MSADQQDLSGAAVRTEGLTKAYRGIVAVDRVSVRVEENSICGLLGRNGAGKTTMMKLLTGQLFPTSGEAWVLGNQPTPAGGELKDVCFVAEDQRYPDSFAARHVFTAAGWFYQDWDADYAADLVKRFDLPVGRRISKLSRGQRSAVGIILGLASRARLTIFDEPYAGLDAVARHLFYDELLRDFTERPRSILVSTHLIDEIAHLLDRVLVIDHGRILIDQEAEALRGASFAVAGPAEAVDRFAQSRTVLGRERVGGLASVAIDGRLDAAESAEAARLGLEISEVSLQQLVVNATTRQEEAPALAGARGK